MEVGLLGTGCCEYNESPEMCKKQHAKMTGALQPPLAHLAVIVSVVFHGLNKMSGLRCYMLFIYFSILKAKCCT